MATLSRLMRLPLGVDAELVLVFSPRLPYVRYSGVQAKEFWERLVVGVKGHPDVKSAAAAALVPGSNRWRGSWNQTLSCRLRRPTPAFSRMVAAAAVSRDGADRLRDDQSVRDGDRDGIRGGLGGVSVGADRRSWGA